MEPTDVTEPAKLPLPADAAAEADDDERAPLPLTVAVESLENWQRKLKIEIAQEGVTQLYEERLQKMSDNATVPGFRAGHAPRALLVNHYGKDINKEVKRKLLEDSMKQALEEQELEVVGLSEFDGDAVDFSPDQPMAYEITVEILPEFELTEYKGLPFKRPSTDVTDDDVDKLIKHYRREEATLLPADEQHQATTGDVIAVDVELKVDGKVVYQIEEHPITILEERILDFPFDVDPSLLRGVKIGETRAVGITTPENFDEDLKGEKGDLSVTVREIKRPELPELDDAFAQGLGADSVDDLKAKVRAKIQDDKDDVAKRQQSEQLGNILLERTPFELPVGMLKRATSESVLRQQVELIRMGLDKENAVAMTTRDDVQEKSRENVEKRFKIHLILRRIAEKEGIEADDDEVHAEIHRLAAEAGRPVGVMNREIEESGRLDEIQSGIRRRKVLDFLVQHADITEEEP